MAEAHLRADTSNVLSKATINASIVFFVLSCALFLGRIYEHKHQSSSGAALPTIAVPAATPVAPAKAQPAPSSAQVVAAAGRGQEAVKRGMRRGDFRVAGALAAAASGAPQGISPPRDYSAIGRARPGRGARVIKQFRESGPARPYYLEFVLRELPRRGPERRHRRRLWGGRNDQGAVLRIELNPGRPAKNADFSRKTASRPRFGLTSQALPQRRLGVFSLSSPWSPERKITPFDLQMPFLYWPDARLMGIERVRGMTRPAYVFLFQAAGESGQKRRPMGGVRAYLDTEYHAPVQTEVLAADGSPKDDPLAQSIFKKDRRQWIPKDIEVRNEATSR